MKRGYLDRDEDISGVTGPGNVAEFVISSDGRVAIFWPIGIGQFPSLQEAINVHGHGGKTRFVILDDPDAPNIDHCIECHENGSDPLSFSIGCVNHHYCPACLEGVS